MSLRNLLGTVALPATLIFAGTLHATPISLNVDTAPNVYGSPDWPSWWADTKDDVADGSFTDMRSGAFPGSHRMAPDEQIVYSTGDLGRRLHWIYWIPDATIDSLEGRFETKFVVDWNGTNFTYDWSAGTWATDAPGTGWIEPSSWEAHEGGVIGSFGHAWWATDNEAKPYSTGGTPYDETDQADVDALAAEVLESQTFARGMTRLRAPESELWREGPSIEVAVEAVPEPGALTLLGGGLLGFALLRRRTGAGSQGRTARS